MDERPPTNQPDPERKETTVGGPAPMEETLRETYADQTWESQGSSMVSPSSGSTSQETFISRNAFSDLKETIRDELEPPLPSGEVRPEPLEDLGWSLVERVGRGARGDVWKVKNNTLSGQEVDLQAFDACKFIPARQSAPQSLLEAVLQNNIDSQYVAKVKSVRKAIPCRDGQTYDIVEMEYIEGTDLDRLVKKEEGILPLDDPTLELFLQLALAIEATHRKKIIHLDIKPSNILFKRESGYLKLADFGISQLLRDSKPLVLGYRCGTPAFMAPEQTHDDGEVGTETDVWGFGATLYFLLSGYCAGALLDGGDTHRVIPLRERAPWLPESFCEIIEKCLAIAPKDRYEDGHALRVALQEWRDEDWLSMRKTSFVDAGAAFVRCRFEEARDLYAKLEAEGHPRAGALEERATKEGIRLPRLLARLQDSLEEDRRRYDYEAWRKSPLYEPSDLYPDYAPEDDPLLTVFEDAHRAYPRYSRSSVFRRRFEDVLMRLQSTYLEASDHLGLLRNAYSRALHCLERARCLERRPFLRRLLVDDPRSPKLDYDLRRNQIEESRTAYRALEHRLDQSLDRGDLEEAIGIVGKLEGPGCIERIRSLELVKALLQEAGDIEARLEKAGWAPGEVPQGPIGGPRLELRAFCARVRDIEPHYSPADYKRALELFSFATALETSCEAIRQAIHNALDKAESRGQDLLYAEQTLLSVRHLILETDAADDERGEFEKTLQQVAKDKAEARQKMSKGLEAMEQCDFKRAIASFREVLHKDDHPERYVYPDQEDGKEVAELIRECEEKLRRAEELRLHLGEYRESSRPYSVERLPDVLKQIHELRELSLRTEGQKGERAQLRRDEIDIVTSSLRQIEERLASAHKGSAMVSTLRVLAPLSHALPGVIWAGIVTEAPSIAQRLLGLMRRSVDRVLEQNVDDETTSVAGLKELEDLLALAGIWVDSVRLLGGFEVAGDHPFAYLVTKQLQILNALPLDATLEESTIAKKVLGMLEAIQSSLQELARETAQESRGNGTPDWTRREDIVDLERSMRAVEDWRRSYRNRRTRRSIRGFLVRQRSLALGCVLGIVGCLGVMIALRPDPITEQQHRLNRFEAIVPQALDGLPTPSAEFLSGPSAERFFSVLTDWDRARGGDLPTLLSCLSVLQELKSSLPSPWHDEMSRRLLEDWNSLHDQWLEDVFENAIRPCASGVDPIPPLMEAAGILEARKTLYVHSGLETRDLDTPIAILRKQAELLEHAKRWALGFTSAALEDVRAFEEQLEDPLRTAYENALAHFLIQGIEKAKVSLATQVDGIAADFARHYEATSSRLTWLDRLATHGRLRYGEHEFGWLEGFAKDES